MGQEQSSQQHSTPEQEEMKRKVAQQEELICADSAKVEGLKSAAQRRVVTLEGQNDVVLSRFALRQLPEQLFKLRQISKLDVSFNRLQSIPRALGQLKQLTWLDVSHNHLHFKLDTRGSTIEDDISVVVELPKLSHLNLSWNMMPSAVCVNKVTSLTHLDLHHNPPLCALPNLANLVSLTYLNLDECALPGLPDGLSALPLIELHATNNQLKVIPATVSKELLQQNNQLQTLPRLPASLQIFCAPRNMVINTVDVFAGCTNLESLDLRYNWIPNDDENFSDLVCLPKLTKLWLGPNKFKGFPTSLCNIRTLTDLDLAGMEFTTLPASFSSLAPTLHRLSLRYNKFTQIPEVVFALTNLSTLDLSGNELTMVASDVSMLTALKHLNLAFNKLKTLPVEIGRMPALKQFFVDENPLDDEALVKLANSNDIEGLLTYIGGEAAAPREYFDNEEYPAPFTQNSEARTPCPPIAVPPQTTLSRDVLRDKILGLFFGAAIGDAVGLSTEFMSKQQASFAYGREDINFDISSFNIDRHRSRWVPGDWTDDTDQMILILENLMDNQGSVNLDQYSLSLLRWAYGGFHEMGDEGGMGIGQTVNKVLSHPLFLADSHKVAQEVWEKNGRNLAANGAVMRTAVLGVPNFTDLDKVISNTLACCKVTHADPRCQASCIAVTVAIALLLQGVEDIEAITATALEYAQKVIVEPAHKEELIQHMRYGIKELNLDDRPSIGYTYKTMGSGFYALRETNFTRAIMRVTWESGDADTNAAVAGAMLGCKLGYTKLPKRWLDNLLHKDWLYEKMEVFLGMLGLSSHA